MGCPGGWMAPGGLPRMGHGATLFHENVPHSGTDMACAGRLRPDYDRAARHAAHASSAATGIHAGQVTRWMNAAS